MKKYLTQVEEILCKIKPKKISNNHDQPVSDCLGIGKDMDTLHFAQAMAILRENTPPYFSAVLADMDALLKNGKVHSRVMLYLIYLVGLMAGKQHEQEFFAREVLPNLLKEFGIKNPDIAYTKKGLVLSGEKEAAEEDSQDEEKVVTKEKVSWN